MQQPCQKQQLLEHSSYLIPTTVVSLHNNHHLLRKFNHYTTIIINSRTSVTTFRIALETAQCHHQHRTSLASLWSFVSQSTKMSSAQIVTTVMMKSSSSMETSDQYRHLWAFASSCSTKLDTNTSGREWSGSTVLDNLVQPCCFRKCTYTSSLYPKHLLTVALLYIRPETVPFWQRIHIEWCGRRIMTGAGKTWQLSPGLEMVFKIPSLRHVSPPASEGFATLPSQLRDPFTQKKPI